tara:strand:- start:2966 stop:4861 length:1896 start_codon:yes stop_codon:yes gene_type:complete
MARPGKELKFRTIHAQRPRPQPKERQIRRFYWDIESWGLNPARPAFIVVKPERQFTASMPDEWVFWSGEEMLDWLDTLPKKHLHIFYAHNGNAFDIYALFDARKLADMRKVASDSRVFSFQFQDHIHFRDSLHLLDAGLSAFGSKGITPAMFIEESHPDFENVDAITKAEVDYCRLDVDILRDAMTTLLQLYRGWTGVENADLPLTCASMAYRVWCAMSWPQEWTWTDKEGKERQSSTFPNPANEAARQAYYGGRVMVFPGYEGQIVQNVMSYDRNSMFPAEMLEQVFPDANQVWPASASVGRVHRLKREGSPYWGHFVLEAGEDAELFLPSMKDGKAHYLNTHFDGFLMFPEVNYALDHGWTLKEVKELWRSRPLRLFAQYVDHFYSLRLEMKARGDQRQTFLKLLLNSLYGKFGSKDRCERVEDVDGIKKALDDPEWPEKWEIKDWSKREEDGFYLVSLEPTIKPRCNFFPVAASITSYARVRLQEAIQACRNAGFGVVYCDTDSVHLEGLTDDSIIPLEISSELGAWGMESADGESVVPSAIYWERKAYSWFDQAGKRIKTKHKGVSESDGDLRKPQLNISVRKYRSAIRRNLEAGVEVRTVKVSRRWGNVQGTEKEKQAANGDGDSH